MLEEIKSYLPKLFLISFIFVFLFLPLRPVNAIFGIGDVGLFDLAEIQLDALDFVDNVVLRIIIFICLLIFESEAFIFLAATLLKWAINLPINLGVGNPNANLLVSSGWEFTRGLVNLLFILIFVFIGLAYILRLETFGIKRALPKLILIALLVNFSLVFVGALVDISDIFRNAILKAIGEDVVTLAIAPLKSSADSVAAWIVAIPSTYILSSALVPYGNAIALTIIASMFLLDIGGITGGIFLKGLFLIVINFVIGLIFFSYFAFFLMRIGIIWILAILSPLAFFCSILPQTQKYWNEWFKTLLEWLILGIFVLFLAGLGLKLFAISGSNGLLPWGGDINTGRGTIPSFTYNYLFLLVYLGVVFYFSKKYAPQMANVLMNYGKNFGKGLTKIATARTIQRDVWGPAAERLAKGFEQLAKEWGNKGAFTVRGRTFRPFGWVERAARRPIAPLIEYAAKQRRITLPAGWEQMSISEKEMYIDSLTRDSDKVVLASKMKREKTYQKTSNKFREKIREARDKLADNPYYKKEVGDLFDAEPETITKELKLKFELSTVPEEEKEKEKERIEKKIKAIIEEFNLSDDKAGNDEAAAILHARELKPQDIAEVCKGSLRHKIFQKAMQKMSSSHLRVLRDSFSEETVREVLDSGLGLNTEQAVPDEEALKAIFEKNPGLVRWAFQTPAGIAMLNWAERFPDFFKKLKEEEEKRR